MDTATAWNNINWLYVTLASISAFVVGGIWYGPLFGKAWMRANGFSEEYLKTRNLGKVFGLSFILIVFAAINLAMFIGPGATLHFAAMAGFLAAFGWVAPFIGVIYLFEKRPTAAFLINAGYCIVSLTLMGIILGL